MNNEKISHTYCLPYYIDKKNELFILMGLKKKYNHDQGYIHSNPGQLVFIGGHLKKNTSFPKNVQIEFHEETGHILDPKRIFLDKDNYKKYYITAYYKCNHTEFKKFDKLINNSEKFQEMDKLCWISFNKCINIMIKYNKNVIENIPKFSLEYTNEFKKRKWFLSLEISELIWAIRNEYNLNKRIKNKIIVKNYIHNNLKNKKFFYKVKKIIQKYIYKISEYDWFEESLYKFKQFQYNQNNKKIKNKKKSKSPPKKKSSENKKKSKSPPKKKSKSPPKKKYIPPHRR